MVMPAVLQTLVLEDDDDHALLLEKRLQRVSDLHFAVTHCRSSTAARAALRRSSFDVIFVDYWLGAETSEAFLEELNESERGTPVIVTTCAGDEYVAAAVTRAGAHRYLRKQDLDTPLLDEALRQALRDSQRQVSVQQHRHDAVQRLARLTPREREIANLIGQGLLSKQIAHQLGCSLGTVNLHRSHVMTKLEAQSVADVVRLVLLAKGSVDGSLPEANPNPSNDADAE